MNSSAHSKKLGDRYRELSTKASSRSPVKVSTVEAITETTQEILDKYNKLFGSQEMIYKYRKCVLCGKSLPKRHKFSNCFECFFSLKKKVAVNAGAFNRIK